jgi:hypothetical protein
MDDVLGAIDLAESYGLKVIANNLGLFDDKDDQIRGGLNSCRVAEDRHNRAAAIALRPCLCRPWQCPQSLAFSATIEFGTLKEGLKNGKA